MRNNLTRFELIDKSCQASTYLNQAVACSVQCSMRKTQIRKQAGVMVRC